MSENQAKVPFVSPAWVDIARGMLEELVSEHGEEGKKCSICEAFAEAPEEFADTDGFAAWHFYIDGKSVRVGIGRVSDTDALIQATWETSLAGAKRIITPELVEEMKKNPPTPPVDANLKLEGDRSKFPAYLGELHNRMALLTE